MKNLKNHYLALVLAIVAGVIMIAPQIIFMWSLGSDYKGVYMMRSDAETHYVARMQELYDGNGVGNAYYFENKNDLPDVLYSFSESVIAVPGRLIGISASTLSLIYKFLLPAIVFLLVYFLILRLTKRRLWSLVGASLVIMGNLLVSIPDLLNLVSLKPVYLQFSLFSRPINPEFTSIIYISYLHLLLSAIKTGKRIWFVSLALLFGASFYLYFYSWTFILAFNVCLALIFLFSVSYRPVSWKISFVTLIGFILGARSVKELFAVKASSYVGALDGLFDKASHMPVISIAGVLVTILFVWYFYKKISKDKEDYFVLGLLAAAFVDVNQQIITGVSMQTGHYYWYFNVPIFMMTLAYLSAKKLEIFASSRKIRLFAVLLIIISAFSASFVQYASYVNNRSSVVEEQKYAVVFDWLNNHAVKNSVVLADESLSDLIPAYTSENVFEDGYGKYYLLSPERRAYSSLSALNDLRRDKKLPFRLDYIVWDESKDPDWKINNIKSVKLLAAFGAMKIYGF